MGANLGDGLYFPPEEETGHREHSAAAGRTSRGTTEKTEATKKVSFMGGLPRFFLRFSVCSVVPLHLKSSQGERISTLCSCSTGVRHNGI